MTTTFIATRPACACLGRCPWPPAPSARTISGRTIALTPAYRHAAPAGRRRRRASLDAWWDGFGDPELSRVVERATAPEPRHRPGRRPRRSSRAPLAKAAGAALLPQAVDATGSVADVQQSLLSPIGEIGSHLPGFQRDYDDYGLGARRLLGDRRSSAACAAPARPPAPTPAPPADQARGPASPSPPRLPTPISRSAPTRPARRRAPPGGASQIDLVDLLNRRTAEGVAADRELHEAQAALEGVRATIPPLHAGLEAELNRLDVLMGAQPGT